MTFPQLQQHCSSKTTTLLTILTLIFLLLPISPTSSQTCQRSCGKIPLKYPFGSGPGCGDPRFQPYVTCNGGLGLTFTTHTGSYPITSIDYSTQVLYISDPNSMSTCSCGRPGGTGFGLDWDAPFAFHDDTVFALLDCLENSPIYATSRLANPNRGSLDYTASRAPLCDQQAQLSICRYLYSCRAISTVDMPVSTCCVYAPVDLGPSFDMDLEELKCRSYSGFYSFNGRQSDPDSWKYGIALKYKFSVYNEFPSYCADCERSFGFCGYNSGAYNSFICNCPSGLNTTSACFFGYSYGSTLLPWKWFVMLVYCMACFLVWLF